MDYYQQAVKEAETAAREAEGAKKLMRSVMATIVPSSDGTLTQVQQSLRDMAVDNAITAAVRAASMRANVSTIVAILRLSSQINDLSQYVHSKLP
jgi:hypothetical protein